MCFPLQYWKISFQVFGGPVNQCKLIFEQVKAIQQEHSEEEDETKEAEPSAMIK